MGLPDYASLSEVKHTFRTLAVRYHPDRNPGNPLAEERFKEISGAYHILGEEDSKREYDLRLSGYHILLKSRMSEKDEKAEKRKRMREELLARRKKEAEHKIISDWDKLHGNTPLILRHSLNYGLIATGSILVFRNWFYTLESFSPFNLILAVMFLLIGNIRDQNLNYTRYLYLELKGKIKFNIGRRVIRNLALGMVLGFGAGIAGAHLMALYHFKHYAVETQAKVKLAKSGGYHFIYEYKANGKIYRKPLPERYVTEGMPGEGLKVRYSSVNPVFAKIVED